MEKSHELSEPGKSRQWFAACVVNLLTLSEGLVVGWCSPVIPQLLEPNNPIGVTVTDEEISWLTGMICVSGLGVTPFLGSLSEALGRKMTGFLVVIPFILTWILNIVAQDATYLLIARFVAGIGCAGSLFLIPLYVSEICTPSLRGTLSSLLLFSINIGILLAFVLGAYLSYFWFNIACMLFSAAFVGTFIFLPETPVYLVRQNRLEDATQSLLWLRGGNRNTAEREIVALQNEITAAENKSSPSLTVLVTDKATRIGLIISIGLMIFQQLSGIFVVLSYSTMIFEMAGSSLSPSMGSIIIGIIQIIGSYMSTLLIERLGRRSLLLISTFGTSFCLSLLSLYYYLQSQQYEMSILSWLPVTSLSIYMVSYCLGIGPCPYIVASEIFRRDISSLAISVSLVFLWGSSFAVAKSFNYLVLYTGIHGSFLFFAICCGIAFAFTFALVPETKGQPLEYILSRLEGHRHVNGEDSMDNRITKKLVMRPN